MSKAAIAVLTGLLLTLVALVLIPRSTSAPVFLPVSAAEAGVKPDALDELRSRAAETNSDAVIVLHDGRLLLDYRADGLLRGGDAPIETMSVTKSVLSLAVGLLLEDGSIQSLDQPVADFFPQWREGPEAAVTVRHLLDHSSGLCADRTTEAIYASPDFVQHALDSGLCSTPGETLFYNNSAINLLAGVIGEAAGEPVDAYLKERLFQPLGIVDFGWTRDQSGNPHGMAGLQLNATDLARIGQSMLDDGRWQGQQVLPAEWVQASFAEPRETAMGSLLWWPLYSSLQLSFDEALFESWRAAGVAPDFIEGLQPLLGQTLSLEEMREQVAALLGPDWREQVNQQLVPAAQRLGHTILGPVIGIEARGYLGQYLTILRDARIVAVRQIRYAKHRQNDGIDNFSDFTVRVRALMGAEQR